MTDFYSRHFELPNIGYSLHKLDAEAIRPIQEAVDVIQADFSAAVTANHDLAGNIVHEYDLPEATTRYIEQLQAPLIQTYLNNTTGSHLYTRNDTAKLNLKLRSTWVNFQSKHEFNPAHTHGGIMSFVIWLKVPFLSRDELNRTTRIPKERNYAGCFEFQYTDTLGAIANVVLPVDHTWENTLCIFPAKMTHGVHPFYTSDDYRISISGNYYNAE